VVPTDLVVGKVERVIFVLHERRVIFDFELAALCGGFLPRTASSPPGLTP
jgi:hypothetical protein